MLREDVEGVLDCINCKQWGLELGDNRGFVRSPWFLRVRGHAAAPRDQFIQPYVGRRWMIARHATPSQLVRIAFDAICHAELELIRESFLYRDQPIFGPTVDVDRLSESMAKDEGEGEREGGLVIPAA